MNHYVYSDMWTVRRIKRWQVPFYRLWCRIKYRKHPTALLIFGRPITSSDLQWARWKYPNG